MRHFRFSSSGACFIKLFFFQKLWNAPSLGDKDLGSRSLKKSAVAAINEFATEMETCRGNICAQVSTRT